MSYGFKLMIEGDYACFTRPELKAERVSYDVPTPGALEGLIKSVYWKPSIRYVIDKIIVFNPIEFVNVRRNEVNSKILISSIKKKMKDPKVDISLYTSEDRAQRASLLLKNVMYGVEFHFEMTGLKSDHEDESEEKHYNILKRRLEKGQYFRKPCLGCSEFPVRRIDMVEEFDMNLISNEILRMKDYDLGYMCYKVRFEDKGVPINGNWEKPIFSDIAKTEFYRPRMVNGVIDVGRYWRECHVD